METPDTTPTEVFALEDVLKRVEPRLKKILSRYRIPAQDADDLLQETFLIMVSKAGSIRNPDAWILATLNNRCVIYWRKYRSQLWDLVDTTILEILAEAEAPAQEQAALRYDLDSLISHLPDRCKSVLRLRYGLGCSTAETAERMGYCKSSIRKVTRRCLATLTERLLGAGFPVPTGPSPAPEED
ncbi:MAG TPA: sigma-70 family RNA polymerase sigma factor [Thermoanaerobaculia bacterium]|nr:sigma-70 family RNA polymerase sigma factor [Thermoanaerobaculia bacterium]